MWDGSFDGKFVQIRDCFATFAPSMGNCLGICSKYRIGDPEVDTKWVFRFTYGMAYAVGLVHRSTQSDAHLKNHGDMKMGEITVAQVYQGMRGMLGMVTETSKLDAEEGIRFRGYSIPE